MKKLFGLTCCTLALAAFMVTLLPLPASAGATLNTQQRVQIINLAANASVQQVKEKQDFPLAKLIMLSALEPTFRIIPAAASNPQVGQTINQFAGASMAVWPGAPQQPDLQALTAFLQMMDANKAEIAQLAMEFNMMNVPNGKAAYRRKVANIKARADEVSKQMSEMVKDAPPAAHFLMSPPHLQMGMNTFNQLFHIVFGQIFVTDHVKKITPELVQEANAHIAKAKGSQKVDEINVAIADSREALALLKTMDGKNAAIAGIEKSIEEAQVHLKKVYDAQVAENRFPSDVWKGSDADRKRIMDEAKAQYLKRFPNDEIIKIHIVSEAVSEMWEAWWDRDDVVRAAYAGYVSVAIVVKQDAGKARVLGESYRKTLSGNDWSPFREWKLLYNYKMLEKNI